MKRLKFKVLSKKESFLSAWLIDYTLLILVLVFSLFGLLMVYDASQFEAFKGFGDKYYFIKQQVIWFVLGILSLVFFSFFDYHFLKKIAVPLFFLSIILLVLVFVPGLGVSAGGAHRWLKIAFLTIQPAEVIKLSGIIFFAALFERKINSFSFVAFLSIIVTIIGVFQKDLGTAIIFSIIAFAMYFLAGAPLKYLISCLAFGLIGFIGFISTSGYRRQRVLAFLDPFTDPQGFSYHISQVLIALGSGGIFGLGVGQSRQKFAYIPEVTTDSIFSIIGEEFGFLGGFILIMLLAFFIQRGFRIASKADDKFGWFLASGITVWIAAQAILNLAAMVSLVPLTGVPLPFISYGGSALLANLTAVGILLNISRQKNLKSKVNSIEPRRVSPSRFAV